jgi:hypothetical protein
VPGVLPVRLQDLPYGEQPEVLKDAKSIKAKEPHRYETHRQEKNR